MFLPGYLLSQMLFKKADFNTIEQLPIWFVLSLGILTIPAIFAYIIPTTLVGFFYFIFGITSILALIVFIFRRKKIALSSGGYDWTCLITFLLALIYAGIIYKVGGELGEDTLYHLVLLKKLVSRHYISLASVFYKSSGPVFDYNYSLWHVLLAMAAKFSGLSIRIVWFLIPSILTPLAIIAYYTLARTIFQNRFTGLVTALILTGHLGGIWYSNMGFNELNAPYAIARYILIPTIWIFLFSYFYKRQKILLGLAAFLPLTLANIHTFYFFLYAITLIGFALLYFLVKRRDKENNKTLFAISALSIVIAGPYLILRYLSYSIDNPWFFTPAILSTGYFPNGIVMLTPHLGYINPIYVFSKIYVLLQEESPAQLCSFLVLPWIFFYLKRCFWAVFLSGSFVTIIGIMLHPVLATLVAKVISYSYVVRMSDLLPAFLILGLVSSRILTFSFKKARNKVVMIFFLGIVISMSAYNGVRRLAHQVRLSPTIRQVEAHPKVYDFLDRDILGPAVIFSDAKTSLISLGYANNYAAVVRVVDSATDSKSYERIQDSVDALNSATNIERTLSILKKYEVDYILLSPNYNTQTVRAKFEIHDGLFKKIFDDDGYVVYEVIKEQRWQKWF